MIILTEVATKLSNILNGKDSEVSEHGSVVQATNTAPFNFVVATEGFHLDSIAQEDGSGNFIPVFISSMGGQFNPIKGLKQGSYSIPIVFYFPVRFKDNFFMLGDFLVDAFVGTILNYGEYSGKAVSNISVPQYGEIQNLDFSEFKKWTEATYSKKIEKMENYMTMNLTLFLTNSAPGLIYGNDVKADFSFTYDSNTYTLNDVDWDGGSLQSTTQSNPEQEEDASVPESSAVPFGTGYGASLKIYPNLTKKAAESTTLITKYFYKELLKIWLQGKIQDVSCTFTLTIAGDSDLKYTRTCFIQSVIAPIEKGQLFGLTISFQKKS